MSNTAQSGVSFDAGSRDSLSSRLDKVEKDMDSFSERLSQCESLFDVRSQGKRTPEGEKKTIYRLQREVLKYKDKLSQALKNSDDLVYHLMKENEVLRNELTGNTMEHDEISEEGLVEEPKRHKTDEEGVYTKSIDQKTSHEIKVDRNIEYPQGYDPKKRRFSISSESYNPEQFKNVTLNNRPKTEEARDRILKTVQDNVLFKHLNENHLNNVVNTMWEVTFKKDEIVMKQGDDGDCLYVVDHGELDVLYSGEKVASLGPGRAFGEIALMYNCPRTATIIARTPVTLWAMDRSSFRRILMEESIRRRNLYQSFLEKVPLLESLYPYERAKVADALEPREFKDGDVIIKQGSTDTDTFFIIEEGTVVCTKEPEEGEKQEGKSEPLEAIRLSSGDYFGELALLTNKPRQATVTASGKVKCLVISKKHFDQVMGPCEDILNRNTKTYESYASLLKGEVQKKPTMISK